MNKLSFGDGTTDSTGAGARLGRSRNPNEELARILGGIGAPPDLLPLSEHSEAPSRVAMLEWPS